LYENCHVTNQEPVNLSTSERPSLTTVICFTLISRNNIQKITIHYLLELYKMKMSKSTPFISLKYDTVTFAKTNDHTLQQIFVTIECEKSAFL